MLVGSAATGSVPYSVAWSPDGRFLAVANFTSYTLQIFSFYGGKPILVGTATTGNGPSSVSWSPNGSFITVTNVGSNSVQVFGVNYIVSQTPQALSDSIVFGNSALGSSYDAIVRGLAGSQMAIDGLINYDCVS
jgi:WD40 repeat protein